MTPDMHARDQWDDDATLINYLATQLIRGRLGLFLGAGVSKFYGLPDWYELIDKLCRFHGEPIAPQDDLVQKAGFLRAKYYKGDAKSFLASLKSALYEGVALDFAKIRQSDMLAAIGSLVMSSKRGSAAKVFTLNYDDLLENYLEFHGFTTNVIWRDNHWAQSEDVTIYHPHGFLPLAHDNNSDDVTLGTSDYYKIMNSDIWKPLLVTALRTHTFIHIGLSGTDTHLQNLLHDLTKSHAISHERTAYHSVRFAIEGNRDEIGVILDSEGVYTMKVANYGELPAFLFKICQAARTLRMQSA